MSPKSTATSTSSSTPSSTVKIVPILTSTTAPSPPSLSQPTPTSTASTAAATAITPDRSFPQKPIIHLEEDESEIWGYPALPVRTQARNLTIIVPCTAPPPNETNKHSKDKQFNGPCKLSLRLRSTCQENAETKALFEGGEAFGLTVVKEADQSGELGRCLFRVQPAAPAPDDMFKDRSKHREPWESGAREIQRELGVILLGTIVGVIVALS
ncbi:uncharacterized protein VTP21DRAFT_1233 [Calcarisporiella thermophila]|uniref:uncharacterized protein n=1 Tax=Calcarisporiella thermophila TaxID=911321 RepID=UPI0037445A35